MVCVCVCVCVVLCVCLCCVLSRQAQRQYHETGPNSIPFEVDSLGKLLTAEFFSYFYLYQVWYARWSTPPAWRFVR